MDNVLDILQEDIDEGINNLSKTYFAIQMIGCDTIQGKWTHFCFIWIDSSNYLNSLEWTLKIEVSNHWRV